MSKSDDDEEDPPAKRRKQRFQNAVSLLIAIEAVLLTIASLGGSNAAKTMINANIQASDTWAFYQAKNIRQTGYALAADELESTLLLAGPTVQTAAREK